jgi:hypothetical protein
MILGHDVLELPSDSARPIGFVADICKQVEKRNEILENGKLDIYYGVPCNTVHAAHEREVGLVPPIINPGNYIHNTICSSLSCTAYV